MTAGDIYNLAGSNSCIFHGTGNGGPASDACFDQPAGLGVDSSGDLFVADVVDNDVREIRAGPDFENLAAKIYDVAGPGPTTIPA